MASKPPTLKKASPKIASLLRRVRRRIRSLVFGEGIAATIAVMIVAFWIAFVFDYLPVRFGYSEASVGMRIGLLVLSRSRRVVGVLSPDFETTFCSHARYQHGDVGRTKVSEF